jgi:hypothetical protein
MKTKIIALLEMGLSDGLLSNLSESQINVLYNKMGLSEQTPTTTTKTQTVKTTTIPKVAAEKGVAIDGHTVSVKDGNIVLTRTEGEMKETEVDKDDAFAGATSQDPVQVQGPDGMGDDSDSKIDAEKEVTEIKKDENNPWAICHSQLGPKRNAKFERCVRQVKQSLKEGKSPMTFFIEEKIVSLVERELKPKMTKRDLIKQIQETQMVKRSFAKSPVDKIVGNVKTNKPVGKMTMMKGETSEDAPAVAPPKTKPGVKPAPRTRPAHPGKNPHPGENPAPKAKQQKLEVAKKEILNAIKEMLPHGKK